jgi:hypothetical protein
MKVIYEASCNSDSIEGRGYKKIIAFFENESDARRCVHRMGRVTECLVFETFLEYEEWKGGETRRRALAKLTEEEREALGLND